VILSAPVMFRRPWVPLDARVSWPSLAGL
jgi:hypothetical protein